MYRQDAVSSPVSCRILAATGLLTLLACGGDSPNEPPDVPYGQTSMVYILNPAINDANAVPVSTPGSARSAVAISVEDGPSGNTGASGDLMLGPLSAGSKTVTFADGSGSGTLSLDIAQGDLREVAVAFGGSGAAVMANLRYGFGGEVVEIAAATPVSEVNAALARSNVIVFLRSGTYSGDLDFSGSNVTLFGEGPQGGTVTIDGNVTVNGSGNRIRGARILGNLSLIGSGAGITYSRVGGAVAVSGSDAVLLNNGFCGAATISGSGLLALGNAGLQPIAPPAGGC
ncbi:MAG: hypothetical protein H0V43_05385 [Gemmatimonadales bacterium]|nr:hypothetical protein [Gemmatimonadales bacterium]